MKITITALILLSVIFSKGQDIKDSLPSDITLPSGFYGFPGERLLDVDTLKVSFLVTEKLDLKKGQSVDYETSIRAMGFSFQVNGYVARKKQSDQFNESFWMTPIAYLDENKKPLRKSLTVWQVKEEPKP